MILHTWPLNGTCYSHKAILEKICVTLHCISSDRQDISYDVFLFKWFCQAVCMFLMWWRCLFRHEAQLHHRAWNPLCLPHWKRYYTPSSLHTTLFCEWRRPPFWLSVTYTRLCNQEILFPHTYDSISHPGWIKSSHHSGPVWGERVNISLVPGAGKSAI